MSNPFFSIIIPAYNSEKHIRRGLDSIYSQTFRDFELIVICDSCGDRTEQIAKEYGAITERVSYGRDGLSRDRGIQIATGTWVMFMDDDDWFWNEYSFQHVADAINRADPDIDMLAFGYEFKSKGYKAPAGHELFTPRIAHVWSKAWRRSSIGSARFGNATFCSDTYFLRDMKANVKKYATLDETIYYYNFMRQGSQTELFCKGLIRQSPVAE